MALSQRSLIIGILWISLVGSAFGQEMTSIDYNISDNKGKLYVYWGWNVFRIYTI